MKSERDVIVNIKDILRANSKQFGYFHRQNPIVPAQLQDINFASSQETQRNTLRLTDLDLFYIAPKVPTHNYEKLNQLQEENLYQMFWEHFTDGEYAEIIEQDKCKQLELGIITIGEEDHNKETKKIAELILYPTIALAQEAYEYGTHYPRMPLSILEKIKKESLESKIVRGAFPQQKKIAI